MSNRDELIMPSKVEQILTIEPPHELQFIGPFIVPVQASVVLKNPTDKKVAFIIKNTDPERYNVSPNHGELASKEQAEISIVVSSSRPYNYDVSDISKLTFLIQTVVINPATDYAEDGKTFQWRDIDEGRIMHSKLKCSFDEMPSVKQHIDLKNHENLVFFVDTSGAVTELQKATTEVKELLNDKVYLLRLGFIKMKVEREKFLRLEIIKLKEELLQEIKKQSSQKRSIGGSQQNRNANIIRLNELMKVIVLLGFITGCISLFLVR